MTAGPQANRRGREATDQKGLVCRYCGCRHFRVIYTRRAYGGRIMRRRECRHCRKRTTTWEQSSQSGTHSVAETWLC